MEKKKEVIRHLTNLQPKITNEFQLREVCSKVYTDDITKVHKNCTKFLIVKIDNSLPELEICFEDPSHTSGWLINEVTEKYTKLKY